MIDKRPLVYYCIALLFGCYSALLILNNNFLGAALAASFLACIFITQRSRLSFIAAFFLVIGFVNYYFYYKITPPDSCTVRMEEIRGFNYTGSYLGRKVILKGDMKGIKEGERIQLNGKYSSAPEYDRGVIGEISVKHVLHTERDVISRIYDFKRKLYEAYKNNIGEDGAAEVMAVSFGDDSYIKQETMNEMSSLGIVHVISVSGLHMALIYKVCEMLLGFGWGMGISIVYCLFTGSAPSTVRSLIMIIVYKLSKKVYKNYDPLSSLSLAAIIVTVIRPANVLDVGCILSFLAVLGIFLHYEKIRRALYFLPMKLNEFVSLTLSAQVYSLPICIGIFNSTSTAAVQGNIFIVPIYSALLVLGNISMLFMNMDSVFKGFCFVIKIVFEAIDGGRTILDRISTGPLYMSYLDGWVLVIIYTSYILYKKKDKRFVWLPLFSIIFYISCSFSPVPQFEYVKVGNSSAVIYRSGLKSILFLNKSGNKEKELLLCKKFNVCRVEDAGTSGRFTYREKGLWFTVSSNKNDTYLTFHRRGRELRMAFVNESIPASQKEFYDIIYLPYKKSYHYYDKLLDILIISGKPRML